MANQPSDPEPPAPACSGPLTTLTDCGACATACVPSNASGATCDTGTCDYETCNGKALDCDSDRTNGCETDGATSATHCGTCSHDCTVAGVVANVVTPQCAASLCSYDTCTLGFSDCDQNRTNGCEHETRSLTECGDCNKPCTPSNADGPTCTTGACDYAACHVGFGDCDNDRANGCETPTTDAQHCGDCSRLAPETTHA